MWGNYYLHICIQFVTGPWIAVIYLDSDFYQFMNFQLIVQFHENSSKCTQDKIFKTPI